MKRKVKSPELIFILVLAVLITLGFMSGLVLAEKFGLNETQKMEQKEDAPTFPVTKCTNTHSQTPLPRGVLSFENYNLQLYEVQCKIA